MIIIWQSTHPVLIILLEGRSSVVYVIIKTWIWISVQTRLQYASRTVIYFDLSSFEGHNLASQSPAAGAASGWCTTIKIPSNELYQNIITVRDAYWSLVWTDIHIQVFMITYTTLDRPSTIIIKSGCLGCQIISKLHPLTQKIIQNL